VQILWKTLVAGWIAPALRR